jgi:hypothetical protein
MQNNAPPSQTAALMTPMNRRSPITFGQ